MKRGRQGLQWSAMTRLRFSLALIYLALGVAACDLDGLGSGSSGSGTTSDCLSQCRASANAGCLDGGFDCNDACTQQGRINCDDEAEAFYTCTLSGCSDVGATCSSEMAAVTACRNGAAPDACVADCIDAQNRGCDVLGPLGTCEALCSNAVAADCGSETDAVLACLVEALDGGDDCFGGDPPAACQNDYAALEAACETLQN